MTTFTWGTVTAVGPLRVRLDGDTAALPFVPDSLVDTGSLGVDDRVRCELSSRRVIVIGRAYGSSGGFIGEHRAGEWAASPDPAWVLADGAILNIADWPRLAAHYASVYGAANHHGGDGITTFATPDTRERTYVNQGGSDIFANLGAKTGAKTHTLTVDEMPSHRHALEFGQGGAASGTRIAWGASTNLVGADPGAVGFSGGDQPHNNVQPSFVCRFVIRAA